MVSKSKLKNSIDKLVKKYLLGYISANSLTIIGLISGLLSALLIFLSGIVNSVIE